MDVIVMFTITAKQMHGQNDIEFNWLTLTDSS